MIQKIVYFFGKKKGFSIWVAPTETECKKLKYTAYEAIKFKRSKCKEKVFTSFEFSHRFEKIFERK